MSDPKKPMRPPMPSSDVSARAERDISAPPSDSHFDRVSKNAGASARLVAAHGLVGVLNKQLPLENALAKQEAHSQLSARDRAFARLIAATTLRRLGQIDGVLKPFLKQLPPALVHNILRTAVAQMLFLGTPPHAAVGETVAVLKLRANTKGFSGMANAILRRVSEQGATLSASIAPQENIPSWLRKSWERAYGRADMRRMATQLLQDPPLDITVKSDPDIWVERLGGTLLPTGTVRLENIGDVRTLEGYDAGDWWVQDIASSLPVKLAGDLLGQSVLDMCAAPGGKTLQLANLGANVTALDRSELRLKRVAENLERTKLSAKIVVSDALEYSPKFEGKAPESLHVHAHLEDRDRSEASPKKGFDLVLLDSPCSATGTYRRHPDVIYNKSHNDIQSLVKIQNALLQQAALWVRPGGQLIYCTCSLQVEEGEARVADFLSKTPEFRLNPILKTDLPELENCVQGAGVFRSKPHDLSTLGGMDGFFIARFRRTDSRCK